MGENVGGVLERTGSCVRLGNFRPDTGWGAAGTQGCGARPRLCAEQGCALVSEDGGAVHLQRRWETNGEEVRKGAGAVGKRSLWGSVRGNS